MPCSAVTKYKPWDSRGKDWNGFTGRLPYTYLNDVATALPVVLNEQGPDGNITYAYGRGLIEESSLTFNYFYHYDGLGSVIGLTDPKGKPQAAYAYDPWGTALLTVTDSVGTKNKFRFTGEALDPGTGLYYLRARYYDPNVGRFITRDPLPGILTQPLSLARFTYAWNRPTVLVDPIGLAPDMPASAANSTINANSTIPMVGSNLMLPNMNIPGGNVLISMTGAFSTFSSDLLNANSTTPMVKASPPQQSGPTLLDVYRYVFDFNTATEVAPELAEIPYIGWGGAALYEAYSLGATVGFVIADTIFNTDQPTNLWPR